MSLDSLSAYQEVWSVDFEFCAPEGNPQKPICVVAKELRSGREVRVWEDELHRLPSPPYAINSESLVVAYYASAEMGCHLALQWPFPIHLLDLCVEFRNIRNGLEVPCGYGLLGALTFFRLDALGGAEKDEMQQLALRGGPWTEAEQDALLRYCASDVEALIKLLPHIVPQISLSHALLRGRYMMAAAKIEYTGIPIDTDSLILLQSNWNEITSRLIVEVDQQYGVYEGTTFKSDRFERFLVDQGIPWPRLPSGRLVLDDDTFRAMAKAHPILQPLRELRVSLSKMRLSALTVGTDGRNRTLLSAFRSKTGRNQPSTTKFMFGPAVWIRSLIRPNPGRSLAYVDWSQQEFGIAAALSQDPTMLDAYASGDPYLAFAKQAGAIPPDGTKETHSGIRDQYKQCALAVQYGMGPDALAITLNILPAQARWLLQNHREAYPKFWQWSDAVEMYAMLHGKLSTVFGWTLHIGPQVNPRSLRNFPMQANGAEMLRLACIFVTEVGITLCAPVHDALLIEAPSHRIDEAVAATQDLMTKASAIVLDGFKLRTEVKVVHHPDRYHDERGTEMWRKVWCVMRERGLNGCNLENLEPV